MSSDPDWMNWTKNGTQRGGSALPDALLKSIQAGHFNYTWRGVPLWKNPFDYSLYPIVLWEQKPRTIIEVGSNAGGSAYWMADVMRMYQLPVHVHSIDLNRVTLDFEDVTFHQGDAHQLDRHFSEEFMMSLPRPLLVVEDASHDRLTTLAVLDFFDKWLLRDEYIIVEDGIITDMAGPDACDGSPRRAIEEWLTKHSNYLVDKRYCDWWGINVTWNVNGFLRKV